MSNLFYECYNLYSLLFLLSLVLRHSHKPVEEHRSKHIKHDEGPHDAEVPPGVFGIDGNAFQENVGVVVSAVLTVSCRLRVLQVSSSNINPFRHVLATSLVVLGLESQELIVGTMHGLILDAGRQETSHEIGKRRDAVHEDPKAGEALWWRENTTENETEREEQIANVAGCFGRVHACDHHVRKGRCEEEEDQHEEEEESATLMNGVGGNGVFVQTNGVIVSEEEENRTQGIPGKLDDDVAEHEDFPAVGLGRTFADFVE